MLFGIAVVVMSVLVSALSALVVDTVYQAVAERRWPAHVPLVAVAASVVALVVGVSLGSALG